ncbi:SdiA-regulated/phytase-like domain-containing protein [Rhizosphaericola mali]|uniref:6-bladed beta-propeller n=1 Tax=Rhizosphaericola mali TaxID=2545455 RepID=A0A5P2G5U2_9BACT|nr:hypothetical protein [Rhizosphaericola mali]QES90617.1 hypothetical protein E0W69_018800 [Rhizosphaericola mali]
MRKIICIFVIALIACSSLGAQTPKIPTIGLNKLFSIEGKFSQLYVDNLGNIYTISKLSNQLKKYNSKGDSIGLFNDVKQFGTISRMDATNPLKLLVYYQDFSTVIALDRFLNNINKLDLRRSGILQAKTISISYDNNLWVFDEQEYKLKKLDDQGNILSTSDDFRVLFQDPPDPDAIIDNDGQLYLYDKNLGWFIMDYYGAVKKNYPYLHWQNVKVENQKLIGREDMQLDIATLSDFDYNKLNLPLKAEDVQTIRFLNDRLFVLSSDNISIYSIQQ